jgi:long-subunit fatty acid transport protein
LIFCFYNTAIAQTSEDEGGSETQSAEGDSIKAIQFAIWDKYQIFNTETSIGLFRLNLVYGHNKNVSFLDIGGFGRVSEDFTGLQLNLLNYVKGNAEGIQTGIYNSAGNAKNIQIGLLNSAEKSVGWQIGIINHAEDINGMQIGLLYNTADTFKGLQIGLFNMNWGGKTSRFFPIVNFSF